LFGAGLPDFSWYSISKQEKYTKCTAIIAEQLLLLFYFSNFSTYFSLSTARRNGFGGGGVAWCWFHASPFRPKRFCANNCHRLKAKM
jgi:hypothetical protein